MEQGPTSGAEEVRRREWHASPSLALAIRAVAFLIPLICAWLVVHLLSDTFYRPAGLGGVLAWVVQAAVVGFVIAKLVERQTRRLLPLAALFNMSLVFPDQAPSRFSVALKSSTVKQLRRRLAETSASGLGDTEHVAATQAVALVNALGQHDRLTRGHTERVRAYADMIAEELGMSADDRAHLAWGSMLHDVGKIKVSPEVLNKNGRPTEEEWTELKNHPAASVALLAPLSDWLGDWLLAASQHHERWDGTGYPLGLARNEISLSGRITAVADAYDVITSKRSYKEPMSAAAARKELVRCAGTQFDPEVVRAFLNVSLGRKWAVGPLAWLAEIPGLQLAGAATSTAVPTIMTSTMAAVSSAALVVAATVSTLPPETLAMVDTVSPVAAAVVIDETTSTTTAPTDDAGSTGSPSTTSPATRSQPTATSTTIDSLTIDSTTTTEALRDTASSTTTAPTGESATSGGPTVPTIPPLLTTLPTVTLPPLPLPLVSTTTVAPTTTTAPAQRAAAPTSAAPTTTTAPPTTTTAGSGTVKAKDDAITYRGSTDKWIWVLLNDNLGDWWTWNINSLSIVSEPSHAKSVSVSNGIIVYEPEKRFSGTDSLTYQICNTNNVCDTATVTITVVD